MHTPIALDTAIALAAVALITAAVVLWRRNLKVALAIGSVAFFAGGFALQYVASFDITSAALYDTSLGWAGLPSMIYDVPFYLGWTCILTLGAIFVYEKMRDRVAVARKPKNTARAEGVPTREYPAR